MNHLYYYNVNNTMILPNRVLKFLTKLYDIACLKTMMNSYLCCKYLIGLCKLVGHSLIHLWLFSLYLSIENVKGCHWVIPYKQFQRIKETNNVNIILHRWLTLKINTRTSMARFYLLVKNTKDQIQRTPRDILVY